MTDRLVVAGASGFLGSRLVAAATSRGFEVVQLVRRPPEGPGQRRWDPDKGELDPTILEGATAVVNLCGVGVGDKRWDDAYKALILSSRVVPTDLISRKVAATGVPVLINASAVGYYGPRGEEIINESAQVGNTFLAGVCRQWEAATAPAEEAGARVVHLRTGLALGSDGGLLPRLSTIVKLFIGGRLGSGKQYFPWISATDWTDAVLHLVTAEATGPVNLTGPAPVTNKEFTHQLGKVLGRPTPWMVPEFALKVVLGEFAQEVTAGQRAIPAVLEDSGFIFSHATLNEALRAEIR
ncbi:TIGR01777 family protein [Nakamurella silvestris]|nr:TIGR01777 family protein [Nakamurella silvestris]